LQGEEFTREGEERGARGRRFLAEVPQMGKNQESLTHSLSLSRFEKSVGLFVFTAAQLAIP
jgi:hypothetical protein